MDSSVAEAVAQLYDSMTEREWARMDRHRTEFYVTLRALREHLPPPPARVLDCGGGPGRYAVELARWGYDVTLFDLSTGNLALAREKAAEAGVTLAGFEQGTALDLSRFADHSFDAVLLMGPLYHLLEEAEPSPCAGGGAAGAQARRTALRRVHLTLCRTSRRGGPLPHRAGGSARPLRTDRGRRRTAAHNVRRLRPSPPILPGRRKLRRSAGRPGLRSRPCWAPKGWSASSKTRQSTGSPARPGIGGRRRTGVRPPIPRCTARSSICWWWRATRAGGPSCVRSPAGWMKPTCATRWSAGRRWRCTACRSR